MILFTQYYRYIKHRRKNQLSFLSLTSISNVLIKIISLA